MLDMASARRPDCADSRDNAGNWRRWAGNIEVIPLTRVAFAPRQGPGSDGAMTDVVEAQAKGAMSNNHNRHNRA